MAPIRVYFSPGIPSGEEFHGERIFRYSSGIWNHARAASINFRGFFLEQEGEHFLHRFLDAPAVIRTTLEQPH
jgi:hypothetical protein